MSASEHARWNTLRDLKRLQGSDRFYRSGDPTRGMPRDAQFLKRLHSRFFGALPQFQSCQQNGVDTLQRQLTAIVEREGDGHVSFCPELDIASQGVTINQARGNLREALELFFGVASPAELRAHLHDKVYVTRVEVAVG